MEIEEHETENATEFYNEGDAPATPAFCAVRATLGRQSWAPCRASNLVLSRVIGTCSGVILRLEEKRPQWRHCTGRCVWRWWRVRGIIGFFRRRERGRGAWPPFLSSPSRVPLPSPSLAPCRIAARADDEYASPGTAPCVKSSVTTAAVQRFPPGVVRPGQSGVHASSH